MKNVLYMLTSFAIGLGVGSLITYLCKTKEENHNGVINIEDNGQGRHLLHLVIYKIKKGKEE